jgi:hypothetical protein
LNLYSSVGSIVKTRTWGIFPSSSVFLNFFLSCFVV